MPPADHKSWSNADWAAHIAELEAHLSADSPSSLLPDRTDAEVAALVGTPQRVARLIDHTLLKVNAAPGEIDSLCREAREWGFKSVCVRPNYAERAFQSVVGSQPPVVACVVIGFHEGTQSTEQKTKELDYALRSGAHEFDVVLNRSHLGAPLGAAADDNDDSNSNSNSKKKEDAAQQLPNYTAAFAELYALRCLAHSHCLKLIFETSQLSRGQIVAATALAHHANFTFVKTSTGFCGHGARVEHVRLMRAAARWLHVNATNGIARCLMVKASGGVRSLADVVAMVRAGADRIGASAGVDIVTQAGMHAKEERRASVEPQASDGHGDGGY